MYGRKAECSSEKRATAGAEFYPSLYRLPNKIKGHL
jgi:hypothetical protein